MVMARTHIPAQRGPRRAGPTSRRGSASVAAHSRGFTRRGRHLSSPWYGVVIAAVITGILGLVSGVISLLLTRRNQTRQATFQQKLDNLTKEKDARRSYMTKEQDARRSYEFDARKRLYTEVRPLLFQISEQAYSGLDRIKRALMGQVALDRNVGSSALRIFAPIVLGRELQQRLTSVDLTLDQSIRLQYMIVRELQYNFL